MYQHSSPPTTPKSPTCTTINTVADTGTTDFLVKSSDIPPYLVPAGPAITVGLPNKAQITSLGSIRIPIPHSDIIITAHVIHPSKLSHNLSSVSQLCVQGCSATFTSNAVKVMDKHGTVILSGSKNLHDLLWSLPLPIPTPDSAHPPQSSLPLSNFAIHNTHDAEFVQFVHAAFGSPAVSTFHRAVRQGYLKSFPRITARMIRRNPPNPIATAMGHLDRVRQGMASTKPSAPSLAIPQVPFDVDEQDALDPSDTPDISAIIESDNDFDHPYIKLIRVDEANHSDLTGKFPLSSRRGFVYFLISVWRGYIHVELLKSRTASEYLRAYSATLEFFQACGNVRITLQRLDNETSIELDRFLRSKVDSVQYVPAHSHRANKAERAIRTFKNHFISTLCTTDATYPLNAWDELIPQCELTLNHLQPFALDPSVSAYEGLHRSPFDFQSHPIAPLGTRVLVFESPSARKTWAVHGVKGFYVGPSLDHHRVFRNWIPSTSRVRESDTQAWFPEGFKMPGSSPTELVEAALRDLQTATLQLSKASPVPSHYHQLVLNATATATKNIQDIIAAYGPPPGLQQALFPALEQRVPSNLIASSPGDAEEQRVGPINELTNEGDKEVKVNSLLHKEPLHATTGPPCSSHPMRLRSADLVTQRIPLPKLKKHRKKVPRPSDLSRVQHAILGPNMFIAAPHTAAVPRVLPPRQHGLASHVSTQLHSHMSLALRRP